MSVFHAEDDRNAGLAERELAGARDSERVHFEGWRVCKDGRHFRAAVTITTLRDRGGSLTGYVKVMQDLVADQQRAHPVFYELLESAPDAMVIVGPDGRIILANAQTDRMFGYHRQDLVGEPVEKLLPDRFRGRHQGHRMEFFVAPTLRQMGSGLQLWGLRCDETEFPVDISLSPLHIEGTVYVSAAIRDITQRYRYEQQLRHQHAELLQAKEELERLAQLDALTGLVNHAETIARLETALQDRRIPGSFVGVLFCDVDHFKAVNDNFGHGVGDRVLTTLAARVRDCVRDTDTVGRIGGDEIVVLLPGIHSLDDVLGVAEKIRHRVTEPIPAGQTVHVTVSIGVTLAVNGEPVSAATTRADAAMYKSKQAGRNTVTAI